MSTPAASGVIRADLQGLRAVAVALVVLFHLRPELVPGGFVGVDVFFAISGFLITAHLLRELEETGTVRLGRFWARRARRLLPAALTVLLVVLVACVLFAPIGDLPRFVRETMWSALYIENWALAGSSVDYLAAESSPSPVQHYWSLSVEEQFYLVWPVLLLVAVWLASRAVGRRAGRAPRSSTLVRRSTLTALLLVFLASIAWSVVFTPQDPSPAYFVTTTRAWEFAAGGLAAVLTAASASRWGARRGLRIAVAWAGLGAVGFAAFGFSGATPFPSATALLPVAGALAVVCAAAPADRISPTALLAVRPVQWLGDRSYAVYLWHWPVLVFAGFLLERSASIVEQVMLIAATLALAEATTRWVEAPVRFGVPAGWSPIRVLGLTAAAMAVVLGVSAVVLPESEARIVAEQSRLERLVETPPDCFGAAELLDVARCAHSETDPGLVADAAPGSATSATVPDASLADAPPERCITDIRAAAFEVCSYGAPARTATRTVALIGDSHAEQWLPAFAAAAETGGWRLLVAAKSSCPFSDAERTEAGLSPEVLAQMRVGCAGWNEDALAMLRDDPSIDTVVVSARARNPVIAGLGESWQETAAAAYADRWAEVPASVRHIVVLRDTPTMFEDVLRCVQEETAPEAACARDRTDALVDDPQFDAARSSADPRVMPLDLTEALCTEEECSPVIGSVLAYRDSHHLSWVYAATLAPTVQEVLDGLDDATSSAGVP